jgi:dTDP-4-amino-4,6-dideoxygalactose transaminase
MKIKSKKLSYGSHYIDQSDLAEVEKSLLSKRLSIGSYVSKFENLIKKELNVNFVNVCNSGTSALHLSYLACNLIENDTIILPAVNFVAAANLAKLMKLKFYFADIEYSTGQVSPRTIRECIKKNKLKKIKAIVMMHMGGYPRNIKDYSYFKKRYKCYLIEDSCHAFGSKYNVNGKNYHIGSCKHSDISTFSFHPLKTITTGEGGAVTTNNKLLNLRVSKLKSHGFVKKKYYWNYDLNFSGYNFRLSDINCALGISQLKKIKSIINKRKIIYKNYIKALNNYKNIISIITSEKNTFPSFHLVIMQVDFQKLKIDKDFLIKKLISSNIYCQFHYVPTYRFKHFSNLNIEKLENSEKYFKNSISIPIYFSLKIGEQNLIINKITSIIDKYAK